MTTLIKRATPLQKLVYHIVRGAVLNALDAHPEVEVKDKPRLARSIAKRAAGTLTAASHEALVARDNIPASCQKGQEDSLPLPVDGDSSDHRPFNGLK